MFTNQGREICEQFEKRQRFPSWLCDQAECYLEYALEQTSKSQQQRKRQHKQASQRVKTTVKGHSKAFKTKRPQLLDKLNNSFTNIKCCKSKESFAR